MAERKKEILAALRRSRLPMGIVEIAERVGVHPNTVRFHLRGLLDDGRVESVDEARGPTGRPALMFRAHLGMDPVGPRDYQLLASTLAAAVAVASDDPAVRAEHAGRLEGTRLIEELVEESRDTTDADADAGDGPRLERLTSILDDLGFAPELDHAMRTVRLRNCPFLELIPGHSAVICSVHLGLMRGALTAMEAAITVTHLVPFAEPDLCEAHLETRDPRELLDTVRSS